MQNFDQKPPSPQLPSLPCHSFSDGRRRIRDAEYKTPKIFPFIFFLNLLRAPHSNPPQAEI